MATAQILLVLGVFGGIGLLLPLALVAVGFRRGRPRRLRHLATLRIGDEPARRLVSSDDLLDPDENLGTYLQRRTEEHQSWRNYAVPLAVFYGVWLPLVLLAYAVLAWSLGVSLLVELEQSVLPGGIEQSLGLLLEFGAVGFAAAGMRTLVRLIQRVIRNDLQPRTFVHPIGRLVGAPVFAAACAWAVGSDAAAAPFVAFVAGLLFADLADAFGVRFGNLLGFGRSRQRVLRLRRIQGVGHADVLRLAEEGIADAQHLAFENVLQLMITTRYPLERLLDWVDQALLYVYVEDQLAKWQALHIRGVLDVHALARQDDEAARGAVRALANSLGEPVELLQRFVSSRENDLHTLRLRRLFDAAYGDADGAAGQPRGGPRNGLVAEVLRAKGVGPQAS